MTTKTSALQATTTFPLEKSDIHYDPASDEVSIKRGKFEAFVGHVRGLEERLEAAEDARDVAQYRARKAGKTADVLQALTDDVLKGTAAVRNWLTAGHTLQELSERTKIPYATCHRIVNERFGTPNLEIGYLEKMISAVSRDRRPFTVEAESQPRFKRVLLGLAKGFAEDALVSSWEMLGSEVSTIHAGLEIAQRVKELHPDLILVDVFMPNLEKSLDRLKDLAKEKKSTIILTGEIAAANSALLQGAFERKNKSLELASEGETVGG
jgi:CheY-like chemotaxis protein